MSENEPQLNTWKWVFALVVGVVLLGGISGVVLHFVFPRPKPLAAVSNTSNGVDLRIRGNRNSKIYHSPDCPQYNNISEHNIVYFKTREEAQAAGFRPAKNCP